MLFRIFIWRDMLTQLLRDQPMFGVAFGYPFRSISLEILCWADRDWLRDGWVTAHNSFLEVIYRAGVIGFIFLTVLLWQLFRMIRCFVNQKSVVGILFCGILINWLVAANFLVILELPYNAIPFWSLFGMTFAYLRKKNKTDENINNPQPLA